MEIENIKKDFKTLISNEFNKIQSIMNGSSETNLNKKRIEFFNKFFVEGLPTLKTENWKYTNLTFLNKLNLKIADKNININGIEPDKFYYSKIDSVRVVLVNGIFSDILSTKILPDGIKVFSVNSLSTNELDIYSEYFGTLLDDSNHTFANINSALHNSVLIVDIEKNKIIDKTIQIINITDSRENDILTNPRILVISGKSSSCKIVETNYTIGENQAVKNIVKEIFMDENSHLNYYKIQDDTEFAHTFDFTKVKQNRDSHFDEAAVSINGKFTRNDLRAELNGENIETHYYGIFIGENNEVIDNHTVVDHAMPNCFSNENYRGILFGKSTGIFNGKILVRRDAQKTNAYQSNKNILLSDNATINTKPELEIYADDVKCSHGATVGALDQTSKFYLQARGISNETAEILLLNGFAAEVISEIKIDELKELILNRIEVKLNRIYSNK
jgi:Fe-S cluster assembly protein SufD